MMHPIYENDDTVADLTDRLTAAGVRLFSFFRMAGDDAAHVEAILEQLAPRYGGRILDAGCGVGEFARLAAEQRPDLEFTLLNISESQLARCPSDMRKIVADFAAIPVGDETFDAVIVEYAIGSCDLGKAMAEFSRVLRRGGVLFIHDVFENSDSDMASGFQAVLGDTCSLPGLVTTAGAAGFVLNRSWDARCSAPLPPEVIEPVKPLLAGVIPKALRFINAGIDVQAAMSRHTRVAMQYSGGKDSTAVIYLLQPWWDRLAVYWVNTGDTVPETKKIVDEIRARVGEFIEVQTDAPAWRKEHGDPSDVITAGNHEIGNALGFGHLRLSSRFDCCRSNIMRPLHARMEQDEISLIVRGTKDSDMPTQPINSGEVYDGVEFLYPIQGWGDADVMAFLAQEGAPIAEYYDYGVPNGSDCLSCTAWWDDRKSAFLREKHPEQHARYVEMLGRIRTDTKRFMSELEREIGE